MLANTQCPAYKQNFYFSGCKSGYGKTPLPEGVSKHQFPKNPKLHDQWLRAIPRKDWTPAAKAILCSLHFAETDFQVERKDSNPRRKGGQLKRRLLKDDAVPRFFQGLPSFLSKSRPKERSKASTSTARHEKQNQKLTEETNSFIQSDQVSNFPQLLEKFPFEFPSFWSVITF